MKNPLKNLLFVLALLVGVHQGDAQVLTNIVVSPINPIVGIGSNIQFTATGYYSNGSTLVLTNNGNSGGDAWKAVAGMPSPKVGASCGAVNGELCVVGGTQELYDYNPNSNKWTNKAAFPNPWCEYSGAAGIGSKLYILGGCANGDCSSVFDINNGIQSGVFVYDVASNAWSVVTSMPVALTQMSVGIINGNIYAAGGEVDQNVFTNALIMYSPTTNMWTVKAPMPAARVGCGAAVVNGKFYVVGGYNGNTNLDSTFVYDPTIDSWAVKKPMPTPRAYLGAVSLNGLLYAIDGNTEAGSTNLVEVYNPLTDTWSTGVPTLQAHFLPQPVIINGTIYIAGNGPGNTAVTNAEAYTPQSSLWSSSNPSVASINATGLATCLTNGTANITATSGNISGNTILTVTSPQALLTNIVVSPASSTIGIGSNIQFTATGYYSDASSKALTNNVTWASGNAVVATIAANGVATGLASGTTTITAISGSVSNGTALTVVAPPIITIQPTNNTVSPNGSVTLNVTATGGNLAYQWQLNGTNIPGANGASLTITNVSSANIGVYRVIVNNAAGSVTSRAVTLASVDIKLFAGVFVNGPLGSNYLIQAKSNLLSSWTTVTNVALPTQPYIYIDYSSPTNRQQFYQAVPQ